MTISLSDILTESFLRKYTSWKSLNEFELNSPLNLQQEYYWQYINKPEFNQYISEHTEFSSWNNMVKQATKEFMAERIGA